MEGARPTALTADEFLVWAREQVDGRFELANGRVVAMAPESVNHARAKAQCWLALRTAISARNLACEALPDGAMVRVNERTVYEPDALVRCGAPLPGDAVEVADPLIVVEVVSPSSRGIDTGVKLSGYFSMPSVRHYLIVDTDRRVVIHHRREADGLIHVALVHDGSLTLDPPGLTIAAAEIFSGL